LPHRLQPDLCAGLARLTPDSWRLAEVGAVMAQPFSLAAAAEVMGRPVSRLRAAMDGNLAAGVMVGTAATLAFSHELVRQAIYQQVPQATRMTLHRRIGRLVTAAHGEGRPSSDRTSSSPTDLVAWTVPGELTTARAEAEIVLSGARGRDSDAELAGALSTLAFIAWNEGRVADALGLQRAAVRRAGAVPSPTDCPLPQFGLATMCIAVGDFLRADDSIFALEATAGSFDHTAAAAAPLLRSRLALAAGRLPAARTEARAALAFAEAHGPTILSPPVEMVLAVVALAEGDLEETASLLAGVNAQPVAQPAPLAPGAARWLEAQLAGARRGPRAAFDTLAPIYDDPAAHNRLLLEEPASAAGLIRTAVEVGETVPAQRVVGAVELLAAANRDFAVVVASAAHARALVDRDSATLERLGVDHRLMACRAAACEDAGELLAGRGHRCPARVQLERALAGFEQLGARRDEARVRGRLQDLGSGRRRSRQGAQPVSGWESLTDAERRVADLVAQGLSNPQAAKRLFLSRHTVDFHLRQVFRKLNIGSRVELTRMSLERDIKAGAADRGDRTFL
jgi:DNA-binding CsgD family transcriptional regulator